MKKWNIGNLWKKYKYVGLVVLAGILLMLLPGKKTAADPQESGGSFSLEDTERRMEELLGRMDGVGRVLCALEEKTDLRVISVCGGLKDNAIPTGSVALVAADAAAAQAVCAEMDAAFKKEYRVNDPAITVSVRPAETDLLPLDESSSRSVVCMLTCLPNGIQAMSADMPGLVQTSLNLGILTTGDDAVHASFSVRSSVATQKQMLIQRLRCLMERLGGSVSTHGEYPGWEYMPQSPLRDLMVQVFTDQYGYAPKVEAIHAGLECGLFSAKLPGLDCVSFGPDLKEIHTFRESMSVASVQRVYAMVVETLKRMH